MNQMMPTKKLAFQRVSTLMIAAIGIFIGTATFAVDFEPGQRWACITDQGAEAFMSIHRVVGGDVSFSWGVFDSTSKEMTTICNQSDGLSANEMIKFCRVLGDEFSNGHILLQKGCAE